MRLSMEAIVGGQEAMSFEIPALRFVGYFMDYSVSADDMQNDMQDVFVCVNQNI